MNPTHPRSEFRNSRTSAAILLALFTLVSPLSPLFASAAQAQGGARRPVSGGGRAEQPADKGAQQDGEGGAKSPTLITPSVVTAPQLKVTMDDGVGAGQSKRPGETLTYTVTIRNTNPTDDATTVKFINDLTANANLTYVDGSVQTQPIARADAFNVLGNVRIDVPAASGLLSNDFDPDTGGNTGLTITTAPTTSARGGEVSINTTTGAFTYNPPAGYDGADSFQYTVTDATGKTDTATATLTVANMIWFVQTGAASCTSRAAGCGRLTNPFSDLQSFQAAQGGAGANNGDTVDPEAGDNIFLFTGNANYTGPLTLLNTQKLIGQGATDTLATIAGVTPPAHSDPLPQTNEPATNNLTPPTITSASGGILLANGNTLRGFNVGAVGTALSKIQGTNFGTLTVGKSTEPDVSLSGAGRMLNLSTGSFAAGSGFNSAASTGSSGDAAIFLSGITGAGALTFAGVTVAGAAAEGIEVTGTSSDISFGAVDISAGTDGVSLSNNGGGTRTFSSLNITGGTGIGFRHFTGGGAVNVTGATVVTNPLNNGIDVDSSNANLSFAATTVNKGSTSNVGVELTNNATRTISFASLAATTGTGFAISTNNSGTVNVSGGSLTQSGAGGAAASLVNTALGMTFTSVSSNGGVNGLIINVGSGTFASGTTNLQNNGGVGLFVLSSSVTANFGNTTVNSSNGNAVDLQNNSGAITFADLDLTPDATFRGLSATGNTGTITSSSGDIAATSAPAVFISGPAGRTPLAMVLNNVDSTNSTTQGLLLNLVSGNLTVNDATLATNIQNPTGTGIEVTNTGAGTINFGNTTVNQSGNANGDDAGTGVVLTNNLGNVTFGALTVTPDSGERGLLATDTDATAAGLITTASGTITTTNDTAVEITGQASGNRTPLNIQLQTVNTTGGGAAANGIRLSNTSASGSPGGFRVLGTGGTCTVATPTCTGGRITGTTGADGAVGGNGIHLQNVDNARFTRVRLDGNPNNGLRGINVNVFIFDTSLAQTNGNAGGPVRESGLNFDGTGQTPAQGLVGSSSITNSNISDNFDRNAVFDNSAGTLNLTVTGSTFQATNNTAVVNDNILFESELTATIIFSVTGSTFGECGGDHIDVSLINTGVVHATITGNTLTGDNANRLGGGITILGASWNGTARYNVSNNNLTGTNAGGAIHANKGSGTGDMQGTISGNTIGNALVPGSGALTSSGIRAESRGAGGGHTVLISNNQIRQYRDQGILVEVGEDGGCTDQANAACFQNAAAFMRATVTSNTLDNTGNTTPDKLHGLHLNSGVLETDNNTTCFDALNNILPNAADEVAGGSDLRPRQRQGTRVELPGYGGGPHDTAAVQAYFSGRNTLTSISVGTENVALIATDGYHNGGAACAQPAAPTLPTAPAMNAPLGEADEKPTAAQQQSQPLTIPGVMITQQPQQQSAPGQIVVPAAAQPAAAAQAVARPKAQSEKSAEAQASRGGDESSKKGKGKVGVAQPRAGMFEVNVGTLPANDEVTITFQATISPTLSPASAVSVSNQGTVTADGGINKVSDDPQTTPPAAGDGNDATVTPIDKFEPAIDVASSDNTTDQGVSVTFTATLGLGTAPAAPAPTGTVSFVDQTDANPANWEVLCSNVTITGATAQCATTAVDAGTRTIAAVYSGDGRYDPATDTVTQTVTACIASPVVTSEADSGPGSLREAIAGACDGTTISFNIADADPDVITLTTAELLIDKGLGFQGPGANLLTIQRDTAVGTPAFRIFSVAAGKTVGFSNLTVANGLQNGITFPQNAGGGIFNEGTLSLSNVEVTGNTAVGGAGGGVFNAPGASLSINNSTLSGNSGFGGGGVFNNGGSLTMRNSTVSGNSSPADGGGIQTNSAQPVTLTHVTVTNNRADSDDNASGTGGGVYIQSGTPLMRNSIVADNYRGAGTATEDDVANGTFDPASFNNLIGTGGSGGLITGTNGNLVGVTSPGLGALALNGGPTRTHKLLAGSAALDAGNNCVTTAGGCAPGDPFNAILTDQRNFGRPTDGSDADTTDTVDIGAVEMRASVQTFADATITQDTSHTVTNFNIGDADFNLTVTATSDNQTLVPDANIAVNAGSTPSQRTLVVTPAAGQTGTANITVTVTDTVTGDSMSDTFQLTVNPTVPLAASTVTITADNPDPSNSGQAVTVTFTVTGSAGTPTGNVVITASGGAETCTASVATGQCDITLTAAGSRTLTATYSGDAAYAGGTDTEPHAVVPNVTISDATASEASQLATFTVHLNTPSTETVTVNFETVDEPAGAGKAVAGQDYTSSSGNVVFMPGETLKTISVAVTNDGQTGEPDETFLVNLTSATNGNVSVSPADGQAVGTITEANNAGAILISEIRTSGPGGAGDQFVEIYNNSDSPVTLNATDSSAGYSLAVSNNGCAGDPVVVGIIPNGTVIPARGHYLFAGSAYSLASSAALNLTLAADINADANVALFSTSDLKNFSSQTRLDAVGFFDGVNGLGGNCELLREGTPLNAAQGSTSQYSFFRRLTSGKPQDTGRSVDDFQIVSTTPSVAVGFNSTPALGAPGPENIDSPIQRNDKIKASLIDPMVSAGESPNSVRRFCAPMDPLVEECNPSRSQNGTFSIRRKFTNNTGANVSVLRFRIVNVTVGPAPAGTADLRAISSGLVTGVTITGGGTVDVEGTTLEGPSQPLGGGFNSTVAAGTITPSSVLAPGASINLQFLLGVQQPGAYTFFVNVEAGPPPTGVLTPAKGGLLPAKEGVNKDGAAGRQ